MSKSGLPAVEAVPVVVLVHSSEAVAGRAGGHVDADPRLVLGKGRSGAEHPVCALGPR